MRNHKKNVKVMFRNFETSFQERQARRRAWRNNNDNVDFVIYKLLRLGACIEVGACVG